MQSNATSDFIFIDIGTRYIPNIKMDNGFSNLSMDYTNQEFEFKRDNNYSSLKGRL